LAAINVGLTAIIMACLVVIVIETGRRSYRVLIKGRYTVHGKEILASAPDFKPPDYGEA
jgi:hypothetical protein